MVRVRVAALIAVFLAAPVCAGHARADWFFGLFGSSEPEPAPRPDAVSYKVEIEVDNKAMESILQDASNLYRLRQDPPETGEGLARRASADLPRLVDALWAEGYYDAAARALVDGQPIAMGDAGLGGAGLEAAANAAERDINRRVVQVRLLVETGVQYHIGAIRVVNSQTGEPLDADVVRPHVLRLRPGDPARANAIRDMQSRVVDALRAQSFPLAKVTEAKAIVRHPEQEVDVLVRVDPGRRGGIGPVTITGNRDVPTEVIRSFIYVEDGDPYSPQKIAALRKSLLQLEAIGSVRILEADHFDTEGNLPLTVVVDERKQHSVSAAAQYSTLDGPSLRADWVDRNVFGGGERLRLSATLGYSALNGDQSNKGGWFQPDRLIGRANANFIKPALYGTRNDYIADVTLAREVTESYNAEYFNTTHVIRHRFDETFSIQGGLELERGMSSDYFGKTNYLLVGFTAGARYDTTDNALDPTKGYRVVFTGGAYPTFMGSSLDLYQGLVLASTYYSVDEDSKYILAGRVGLGAMGGSDILDIPDNRRFFAGGGGSVRGYAWRSLAPLGANNQPIGGESLFEASVEARVKITDSIGVVPFADAGTAYASSFPNFTQDMRYSVGLGLRYYTGFGPIRLDVATPLSRSPGTNSPVAVYIGIGQAF
jgi:translocation and assembly module TamA